LSTIAADPQHLGAEIGFFAVLHSWGQNLFFHPHLHCVVPGGGISPDGARWISCRTNFFLPVKVLSRLFRRLFLRYLQESFDAGKLQFFSSLQALQDRQAFTRHLDFVRDVEWVVYAKPPFAGPQQVVDYVGRYTHRVAISNHRIVDVEDGQVKFNWRDYRDNNQQKTMPLSADEFIGRFLLHILPSGFHRIRYSWAALGAAAFQRRFVVKQTRYGDFTLIDSTANRPSGLGNWVSSSVLNALMTDEIESFILCWRLKIRIDGFKVRVPGPGSASR
jgi:Putative transposase